MHDDNCSYDENDKFVDIIMEIIILHRLLLENDFSFGF